MFNVYLDVFVRQKVNTRTTESEIADISFTVSEIIEICLAHFSTHYFPARTLMS